MSKRFLITNCMGLRILVCYYIMFTCVQFQADTMLLVFARRKNMSRAKGHRRTPNNTRHPPALQLPTHLIAPQPRGSSCASALDHARHILLLTSTSAEMSPSSPKWTHLGRNFRASARFVTAPTSTTSTHHTCTLYMHTIHTIHTMHYTHTALYTHHHDSLYIYNTTHNIPIHTLKRRSAVLTGHMTLTLEGNALRSLISRSKRSLAPENKLVPPVCVIVTS